MAQQVYLPVGYYQVVCEFGGAALPQGADIVFHGQDTAGGQLPVAIANLVQAALRRAPAFGVDAGPFNVGRNLSNQVTLTNIQVKLGPLATGASYVLPDGGAIGGGAGDPLPPNVAILVAKHTALGGRRGRGRLFVPGLTEAQCGPGGIITAGELTAMQAAWDGVVGQLIADHLPMCLAHRYAGPPAPVPPVPTPVDNLTVEAMVATQRNRLRR